MFVSTQKTPSCLHDYYTYYMKNASLLSVERPTFIREVYTIRHLRILELRPTSEQRQLT